MGQRIRRCRGMVMTAITAIKLAGPVPEVVEKLRGLLASAEAGELRAYVAVCDYGHRGYLTTSAGGSNPAEVVGMLNMAIFDRLHAEASE